MVRLGFEDAHGVALEPVRRIHFHEIQSPWRVNDPIEGRAMFRAVIDAARGAAMRASLA